MNKNYLAILFILFLILVSCDPSTSTSYYIENQGDEDINIYIKSSDLVYNEDTTFRLESQQQILYESVERIGHDSPKFDYFIQLYDSIVAIKADTIFSKNLIEQSDWIFTIKDEDMAEYRLIVSEKDF